MRYDPGTVLGEFRLKTRIGKGCFSDVWLAEHVRTGAPVAVKICVDPAYVWELRQRQPRPWASHPSIAGLLEVHLEHETPHLVSEYVPGVSLRQLLRERTRLGARETLEIVQQVLEALAAGQGRVHGGLRPENILIDSNGRVRVTDFLAAGATAGVAQRLQFGAPHGERTSKMIVGIFDYLSPEQKERQPLDGRADLYTLGIVMYEMLTGSRHALRFPIEGVPEEVSAIVARATQAAPQQRYASAQEMKRDVSRALERFGGGPQSPEGIPRHESRAGGGWLWLSAVVVLLAALGLIAGFQKFPGLRREAPEFRPPELHTPSRSPAVAGAHRAPSEPTVPTPAAEPRRPCGECLGTQKCKICVGRGTVECGACLGNGHVRRTCDTCRGEGTCATCRGEGEMDCKGPNTGGEDECDHGVVRLRRSFCLLGCPQHFLCGLHEHSLPNCPRCGGDARCSLCSTAHGEGKIRCEACNGARECAACRGARQVEERCVACEAGRKPCVGCSSTGRCPSCTR